MHDQRVWNNLIKARLWFRHEHENVKQLKSKFNIDIFRQEQMKLHAVDSKNTKLKYDLELVKLYSASCSKIFSFFLWISKICYPNSH